MHSNASKASAETIRLGLAIGVALWMLFPLAVRAQFGDPITNCDYRLDLVTGPVLGSGRVVGLGGAYTALASGIDGAAWTPASYASRTPWDDDWFEWNGTIDLMPSTIRNSDFDNNGETGVTYGDMASETVGLGFQLGPVGFGAVLNGQSYAIYQNIDLSLILHHYGVGYMFGGGELVIGLGLRAAQLSMSARGTNTVLVDSVGLGPEVGALFQPRDQPFRLGMTARPATQSSQLDHCVSANRFLPKYVYSPFEVQLGVAFQFGPRPLNRRWDNPHDLADALRQAMLMRRQERKRTQLARERFRRRLALSNERSLPRVAELEPDSPGNELEWDEPTDREFWRKESVLQQEEERELDAQVRALELQRKREIRALPRKYLLVSSEVILIGPTDNGVGLESFLSQRRQDSGRDLSVGLRLGIEGEPIANWLQMRAGTYLEPSRFRGVGYRAHGTLGLDVRLFSWNLFGLLDEFTLRGGASADVATRYLNASLGIGLWH